MFSLIPSCSQMFKLPSFIMIFQTHLITSNNGLNNIGKHFILNYKTLYFNFIFQILDCRWFCGINLIPIKRNPLAEHAGNSTLPLLPIHLFGCVASKYIIIHLSRSEYIFLGQSVCLQQKNLVQNNAREEI